MFDIPSEKIGQVTSELTIWSLPFSMITTFFVSYIFEILGRRTTLFMSFFLTSIIFYLLPYTAPNYNYLIVARCAIGVTMSAPISHPLIADYINRNSRGKAIAMNGIGLVIGEILAMGVLFNFTKDMSYEDAFKVAATLISCISFFLWYAIKDPDMKKLRNKIDLKIKSSPDRVTEGSQ
jgi:MFS family permease